MKVEISFLGEFKMKKVVQFSLLSLFVFGVLGTVALKALDRPIAHVNERGECEKLLVIEDHKEVEKSCPKDWDRYKKVFVLSKEGQDEIVEQRGLLAMAETEKSRQQKK